MAILITEPRNYSPKAIRLYQHIGHVWLGNVPEGCQRDVKVLVVRLAYWLDEAFLSTFPSLHAIVTPTTGLTHIQVDACETRGVKIFSLALCRDAIEQVTSTSELSLGLIISLLRRIPQAPYGVVKEGCWDRDRYRSRQLSCLSLGIVGLGRVGSHLASYARSLGMKVSAFDPYQTDSHFEELGVKRCQLRELLSGVDILSIHANLTTVNHGLIGQEEIALLPPHALIINTARGELLDEQEAAKALRAGRLSGIAVDVLSGEHGTTLLTESPLICAAREGFNVIITPHIGGCTSDAMHITEERMAEIVVNALANVI